MVKKTKEAKARAEKLKAKKLVAELENLYLREATELGAKGLFQRVLPALPLSGGSIDKDTAQVSRIKEIILELKETI